MIRSASCSAVLLLGIASVVQADPIITSTCEWVATGDPCGVGEPTFTAELQFSAQSISGSAAGTGEGFADVSPEFWHLTFITYSASDFIELPFIVRGGSGSGMLRTNGVETSRIGGCSFGTDPLIPLGEFPDGSQGMIPFTYNKPIFFTFNADCGAAGYGNFAIDATASFEILAPEGGYFEQYVAPVPEPASLALVSLAIATLYRFRRFLNSTQP